MYNLVHVSRKTAKCYVLDTNVELKNNWSSIIILLAQVLLFDIILAFVLEVQMSPPILIFALVLEVQNLCEDQILM